VHEVIERVPLVVVAGFAVEVSEVGAGKVGPVFLDELEEEGVLGALEADRAKRRKPKQQFGKPENGAKILRQGSLKGRISTIELLVLTISDFGLSWSQ
jgi:hypothetical protein